MEVLYLRSGLKLALITMVVTALAGLCSSTSFATSSNSPRDAADTRREALIAQLQALRGPHAQARDQLLAAERQLAGAQARLTAARSRLTSLNTALLSLSRHIADDEHVLTTARGQLAALVRSTYEVAGSDGFAAAILSSGSFNEVVDRYRGAEHVTDQVRRLQETVRGRESALLQERRDLESRFAEAQAIEDQLSQDDNRMLALVAERDIAFQAIDGPSRKLAKEIADLDQPVFPPATGLLGNGTCGNHFAFGQCTYYVATRRCVPWFGNAGQWLHAAAEYGFATGRTPRVGAVAVWRPGQAGASPAGHVGFVEAVGPEDGVPAGTFRVSEMNWGGWDRVDYRIIDDDAVMGFVYARA
jgi:peptidoglycan hydrolase CwlO-like protein